LAVYALSQNFQTFFSNLNPGSTFTQTAASQHNTIRNLIEDRNGPAAELAPVTFLQGSYRQQTAIYAINDVDIVALCNLSYPGTPGGTGKSYGRDEIFRIIAAPLLADGRYRDKVRYGPQSMCIKVDLGIKVEILPVVFKKGATDSGTEPFVLYRPEKGIWEDGYARYHQTWLSMKNSAERTGGNFIPAIKVLKHIRSLFGLNAVSFHLECLLNFMNDANYIGGPADYIATVFRSIAAHKPEDWYKARVMTPCGDRDIFTASEWKAEEWWKFHELIVKCSNVAEQAITTNRESLAIENWQAILGNDYFPARVTL
jgi:hypothetical protein